MTTGTISGTRFDGSTFNVHNPVQEFRDDVGAEFFCYDGGGRWIPTNTSPRRIEEREILLWLDYPEMMKELGCNREAAAKLWLALP